MRIENLRTEEAGEHRRIVADVLWESAPHPAQTLYFSAPYPFAADLQPSPDAFMLACLPFAVWWGEQRVQIEGALCTQFRDGLQAVMALYAHWYSHCRPLSIEPLGGYVPTVPRHPARTASLLSGGIDGLTTLRANRLDYPASHPEFIRDCIVLFGAADFENTAEGPVPERLAAFQRLVSRLQTLAGSEEFQLIPVHTNTRLLSRTYTCWQAVGFGAANVAVTHALSRRFNKVLFASDGNGVDPYPAGSHPLLDQHFSTASVQVQHQQAAWTRIDKLRLLADWPPAMQMMQPCHYVKIPPEGRINCGHCEKCVRTMLGLLCIGKLSEAGAFVEKNVTAEMIRAIPIHNPGKAELLEQLVQPLRDAGYADLAHEIQRKVLPVHVKQQIRSLVPEPVRRWKRTLAKKLRPR